MLLVWKARETRGSDARVVSRASDEEIRVEVSDYSLGFCTEPVTIVILRPSDIAPNVGESTNGV
jgi:hypothetical protein